jgi:hypothetical protein
MSETAADDEAPTPTLRPSRNFYGLPTPKTGNADAFADENVGEEIGDEVTNPRRPLYRSPADPARLRGDTQTN